MASELRTQNAVLHQEWLTNCNRSARLTARVNYVNKATNPTQVQCRNPDKWKATFIIQSTQRQSQLCSLEGEEERKWGGGAKNITPFGKSPGSPRLSF
jgi:hypothetical protein